MCCHSVMCELICEHTNTPVYEEGVAAFGSANQNGVELGASARARHAIFNELRKLCPLYTAAPHFWCERRVTHLLVVPKNF